MARVPAFQTWHEPRLLPPPSPSLRLALLVTLIVVLLASLPPASPPAQAQDDESCSYAKFDTTDPDNWVFLGHFSVSPCPCPPGAITIGMADSAGNVVQWGCDEPALPPDKPGVSAGAYCLPGDSRTVALSPAGGDTHQIEINTGGVVTATSSTFTGLVEDVGYRFRGQSSDAVGSSGWSEWTPPVYQDQSAPTTTVDQVGIPGDNGWWQSSVSVALLAVDGGCLGVSAIGYTLDGAVMSYDGTPFLVEGDGVHTLAVSASDGAHTEPPQTMTIGIDTVPPQVSLVVDGPPGQNGWFVGAVTLTVSAADVTSGVAATAIAVDGAAAPYSGPVTVSVRNGDDSSGPASALLTVDGQPHTYVSPVSVPADGGIQPPAGARTRRASSAPRMSARSASTAARPAWAWSTVTTG